MKITPVANNRVQLKLDNGEVLDIMDGTIVPSGGLVLVSLSHPTSCYLECEQQVDTIRITTPHLVKEASDG